MRLECEPYLIGSPQDIHLVGPEGRITRYQGYAVTASLRDEQPVEGILVMRR